MCVCEREGERERRGEGDRLADRQRHGQRERERRGEGDRQADTGERERERLNFSFSTVKILALKLTDISAVVTVLIQIKTFIVLK